MKRIILLAALALSLSPALATAQVDVSINLGLPVAPPLVVVQPGIQVVENYGEEVFYTRGWYWCRRGPYWYRARRPHANFMMVEPRYVPRGLVRLPPGQYRHWRRAEAKEARREMKMERKAWKGEPGHGHGGGYGGGGGHGHGRHDD